MIAPKVIGPMAKMIAEAKMSSSPAAAMRGKPPLHEHNDIDTALFFILIDADSVGIRTAYRNGRSRNSVCLACESSATTRTMIFAPE